MLLLAASSSAAWAGDLSAVIAPILRKHNLPALGVAAVTRDGVESVGVAGVRRYGDPAPARLDDGFALGSDTKAVTATMLAKLVEQGRLSWASTIGQVFRDVPHLPAWENVTLDQLLAHRAGFAHDVPNTGRFSGPMRMQRENYARVALMMPPKFTPGSGYHYSNAGYIMAGIMGERAAGRSWEDLITELVFRPLGMTHSGFGGTPLAGHRFDGAGVPEVRDVKQAFPVAGPAGGIQASLADWGRFIADMLASFEGRGKLLKPASYEHLHQPTLGGKYAYGWGWSYPPKAKGPTFFHMGSVPKGIALAWVYPWRKLAILVATNIGHKAKKACIEAKNAVLKLERRKGAAPPPGPAAFTEPEPAAEKTGDEDDSESN